METEDSTEAVLRLQRSLQKFIDHVDNLEIEDDPSGDGFSREFRMLRELGLRMREDNTHPAEEGRKPHNLKKNRYKDILPFDETRVVLEEIDGEPGSDYINANYIRGNTGYNSYIATQGPLPATVDTFWRMIWQCNVRVVTMACRLVELGKRKCEQYWPEEVKGKQDFGSITVTLVSEDDFADHCTKRVMSVQKDGTSRLVTQFQYTGWPDHDIPNDIEDILEMIALMRHIKAEDKTVPVVIHCSAGCGRTGTICAIDYAWDELKSGKLTEDFNLYNIVKEMREQRQSMIQAPEQYQCAHVAIKLFFEKHQQLMEDHTYGNVEFGNEDEDDSGYADPNAIKNSVPKRKVSAMVDDIENTIQLLTMSKVNDSELDPTPSLVPEHAVPAYTAPAPPTQSKPERQGSIKTTAAKPTSLNKPELAKKPSVDSSTKPPSPSVKQAVFKIQKIENIPESKGNPPQKVVQSPTSAEKHDINMNKPLIETKRPSLKATKAVFEANTSNVATQSQAPTKQNRPLLSRVESRQTETNQFKTVISIGGPTSAPRQPAAKTVSNPVQGSAGQAHIQQKSKTLPTKSLPGVYEAPQSSVPPAAPTQNTDSVYSYAADPGRGAYSSVSSYSNVDGPGKPSTLAPTHSGAPSGVSSAEYNGIADLGNASSKPAADMYAFVSKPAGGTKPKEVENVYESVAVSGPKSPPPIPDRNYVEEEKPAEKPGEFFSNLVSSINSKFGSTLQRGDKEGSSPDQQPDTSTLGRKGKIDTLKQMFNVGKGSGSGSSDQATSSGVPGFKSRVDKPKGPRQPPAVWKVTTKM